MDALKRICPCDLILLGALLAFPLCRNLDADDMNLLGNFIVAIGSLLLTGAAGKAPRESECAAKENDARLKELQSELDDLRKRLLAPEEKKTAETNGG